MALFESGNSDYVPIKMLGDTKDINDNDKLTDIHHIHIPIHLKFENLVVKCGEKTILDNISGEFLPGELVAILGPSGAGKSTLLNFLAGRTRGMELENGKITINGQKATKTLRRKMGYVLQENVFFSHLTVKQTLQFVGDIRLPERLTKVQRHKIVHDIIRALGLKKCEDTVMGGGLFVTGCSGGEKKRCSIATELITNPSMLIMDEPTSGLDSSTAFNLISTLKTLAKTQNRTIVTTIHQPSSHVFHMFDKLLLIANGKVAYSGKTSDVLKFFEFVGQPCYRNWNPADFIMEQLSGDGELAKMMPEKFIEFKRINKGDEGKENGDHFQKPLSPNRTNGRTIARSDEFNEKDIQRWPTGYKTQVTALCRRAFIQFTKDMFDKLAFIQTFAVSLICGLLWWNTPYDEESLTDRSGVIFFVCVHLMMNSMFFALITFPAERSVIAKERGAGMYRLSAYYSAKLISEIPALLLQPMLLYTIVYWMIGLNRSPMYLVAMLLIATGSILSHTIGLVLGGAIKQFKQSITSATIISLATSLIGGFYTKRIPWWLDWTRYASHVSYAYNILIRVEFEYAREHFSCAHPSIYEVCVNNTSIAGATILEKVKTIDLSIGWSFVVLWGMIVFFQAAFYIVLRYRNKPT